MSATPPLTTAQHFRMSLVFTAFMLLLTGSGIFGLWEDLQRAGYKEVQGKMVHIHQFTGFKKASKANVPQLITDMEFSYEFDGKSYSATEQSGFITDIEAREIYAAGNPVTVFVDPNHPTHATLKEGRSADVDTITLGITALAALIGLGVNVFLYNKMDTSV